MREFEKFMDDLLIKENITTNSSKKELKAFDKKYKVVFQHYFSNNCNINTLRAVIEVMNKYFY